MNYDIIFILNRHDNNFSFSFRKLNKKCRNICNYYLLDLDCKYVEDKEIPKFTHIKTFKYLKLYHDTDLTNLKYFKYLKNITTRYITSKDFAIFDHENVQNIVRLNVFGTFCGLLNNVIEKIKLYKLYIKDCLYFEKITIKHMNLYHFDCTELITTGNMIKNMYLHTLNCRCTNIIDNNVKHMFLHDVHTNHLLTDDAIKHMQLYNLHLACNFIITDYGIKNMNLTEIEIEESNNYISDKVLTKMDLLYICSYSNHNNPDNYKHVRESYFIII